MHAVRGARMARPNDFDEETRSGKATERLDLRVTPEMKERLERQAERHGISVSAYLKQAATRSLEQDEATDPDRR